MTLERQPRTREIVFHCDNKRCAEVLRCETDELPEAMKQLKEAKWSVIKEGSEWEHFCEEH
jgi:hypothetical protein